LASREDAREMFLELAEKIRSHASGAEARNDEEALTAAPPKNQTFSPKSYAPKLFAHPGGIHTEVTCRVLG
jgi:hypothetical protein